MNTITKHPYNFQLVPVGQINVDHLYQRDKVSRTVKGIINNFDYHKVNPIKCVFRDGEYFTFDGQNTAPFFSTMTFRLGLTRQNCLRKSTARISARLSLLLRDGFPA